MSFDKSNPNCRIVCAAMLMEDGLVVPGARHFSPDMRAVLFKIYGMDAKRHVKKQGFIDQFGNFYTRQEAWIVAESKNQIVKEVSTPGILYSENLY